MPLINPGPLCYMRPDKMSLLEKTLRPIHKCENCENSDMRENSQNWQKRKMLFMKGK